ncbi:hypothetical protein GWN42_02290, partial [candidate division KSB1 bacterium]|nr:hypothetical protein [Phycisphaerae bacterium]NIU07622.1 hypothetical protein [Phycisphaerae bacterium]NIV91645.1 hypothetical protein [candidate division KSB1 bacterium]NIX29839.1 hypothetical protein [Phycisphaerae bacterium]
MIMKQTNTPKPANVTKSLSDEAAFFLQPELPKQRQYEALRAYFVDQLPVKVVAERFGYTPGAFHALCHTFRHDPQRNFFVETQRGPKFSPKRDRARTRVIALRKKNYSVQDIHQALQHEGVSLSCASIWKILNEEGFGKLPRRKDEQRPERPRADQAAYADIRQLSLAPRVIETRFGGLFLLMKLLAEMKLHQIPKTLHWYGSKMIPAENAFLASLVRKLIGKERKSHIMDLAFDEGA